MRWVLLSLIGLLGSAAIALGIAVAQRTALAERLAVRALAARGVPASLSVARLDLDGAEIAQLALGEANAPDLAIERVALAWSWDGLRARRLDRVDVRGVRARARVDESGLHLGALDALLASEGAAAGPLALPFAEAHLQDARAEIDSQQGRLALHAEGDARPEGDIVRATFTLHGESAQGALDFGGGATVGLASQEVAGAGALRGVTPWGTVDGHARVLGTFAAPRVEFAGEATPDPAALPLRASAPIALKGTATRDASGALAVEASLAASELEISDLARATDVSVDAQLSGGAAETRIAIRAATLPELAALSGIALDARYADGALRADVRVAKLVEASQPPLIAPLGLDAQLSGSARSPGDGFVFALEGHVEPLAQRAELRIRVAETDLAPKARQPAQVFPWLAGLVERAKGHVGLEARAVYENGALSASAVLAFRDVDLRSEYATLRRLNGLVTVIGPEPLITPPAQTLWIAQIEGALPLANGTIGFELQRDGMLRVERAEWSLAGGKLILSGSFPLEGDERVLVLQAEGLSVEQILAALDFEGLSGTGSLDGVIPVHQRGREMLVAAGELRAGEPGVIRFTGGAGAIAQRQPQLATVVGALEDLHYEELTLTLSGDVADRMAVRVHVRGRNPNFQKGRPVVLNVNVDAPVGSLLKAGLVVSSVPEEIEGQVKHFFGREKQ